jgi:hypothetical protein
MGDVDPEVYTDESFERLKLWQSRNVTDLMESSQRLIYLRLGHRGRVLEDRPACTVLNLWEVVLCAPNKLQQHTGSAGLDEGFSFIFHMAHKRNYHMLRSVLCVIIVSRMIKDLDACKESTPSLEYVRLRCLRTHALTLREWLGVYNARAYGPSVDLDSLFSMLAYDARRSTCKSIVRHRHTFGGIVSRVRAMMAGDADAGWLREHMLRAVDSLESRVHPKLKPVPLMQSLAEPTAAAVVEQHSEIPPRPPHDVQGPQKWIVKKHSHGDYREPKMRSNLMAKRSRRPFLNFDEHEFDCGGDTLDENRDDFSSEDGCSTPAEDLSNSPQLTSNAQVVDHFTGSWRSVVADERRAKETVNDEESLEPVPYREYELEGCDDITITSWVVDRDQYMTATEDASSHREWDMVSSFSADIDEMSFQSVAVSEQGPHRTGLSYSQALKSGQAPTMTSIPESNILRAPCIKRNVSPKQKVKADDDDDSEFLLFDAESIRDGVKRQEWPRASRWRVRRLVR